MKKDTRLFLREVAYLSSAGVSIGLCVAIGVLIGLYLDRQVLGTTPWMTILFLFFGIAAGARNMWLIYKRAMRIHADEDEKKNR